jgi:hypothetical protein
MEIYVYIRHPNVFVFIYWQGISIVTAVTPFSTQAVIFSDFLRQPKLLYSDLCLGHIYNLTEYLLSLPVNSSVCQKQLENHWMDLHEIWIIRKIGHPLKFSSHSFNVHYMWRPTCVSAHISSTEKCFIEKSYRKKHILYPVHHFHKSYSFTDN